MSKHYNEEYFKWQKNIGVFGAWANKNKYINHIQKDATLLDFGCGGGFLLNNLPAIHKVGIEINPTAAEQVKKFGIQHFFNTESAIKELGPESIDIIISSHALEHTFNPLQELRELYKILRQRDVSCKEDKKAIKLTEQNKKLMKEKKQVMQKQEDFNMKLFAKKNHKNLFTRIKYSMKKGYKFSVEEETLLNMPLLAEREIYSHIQGSGLIHFFVPCDNITYSFNPNDVNKHLFSWSPMNLGNIFTEAGFNVVYCQPFIRKWPPNYLEIAKEGWEVFDEACKEYGKIENSWFQIEILAEKLKSS